MHDEDVNEDEEAYRKERENDRIESCLYPSEGFNYGPDTAL